MQASQFIQPMKYKDMKYTMMMGAIALAAGFVNVAGAEPSEHEKVGHQSRGQQSGPAKIEEKNTATQVATADGKKLPGRDCKLYEGGTRQHTFPQYEIGNPNRPECQ